MSDAKASAPPEAKPLPEIRIISNGDIRQAVRKGAADLQAASYFSLFFGLFYAAAGWIILYIFFTFEVGIYAYPATMGFPLIAPFVAAGLYEISRRLEREKPLKWAGILASVKNAGGNDLSWMAMLTTFAYIIWVDIAAAIYVGFFGLRKMDINSLVELVFTTPKGLVFFVTGNLVGAILSTIIFSLTVVSFPLLFDREVDFVTAMITSVKAVKANPWPMVYWASIIFAMMAVSMITLFVALIVLLPLLGHATWHVYRTVLAPEKS
ncbi:MAG: DUF2189 domain-containing protein [Hyphomicrobiales bacterium]